MINRALIVRKPHVGDILSGIKTWEMRSTRTSVRGRIGLIEAGSGLIVGEVDLVDELGEISELTAKNTRFWHQVDDLSKLRKWKYIWQLANAKRYDTPIPYNHPKGAVIWVKINPDLLEGSASE